MLGIDRVLRAIRRRVRFKRESEVKELGEKGSAEAQFGRKKWPRMWGNVPSWQDGIGKHG